MSEGRVLTIHLQGKFYRANETDAVVMHNVMHYKLNRQANGSLYCSFPENALVKVITKLRTVSISFRIYKPIPTDMLHVQNEQIFENNLYEQYMELEEEDLAYEFICRLCEMCEYATNQKNKPKGVKVTLDLENEEIRRIFLKIKQKLGEQIF